MMSEFNEVRIVFANVKFCAFSFSGNMPTKNENIINFSVWTTIVNGLYFMILDVGPCIYSL